jgi:eukaryotic-like serine/threonine-protein kinase
MRDLDDRIVEGGNSAAVDPFDRRHARRLLAALGRAFGRLPDEQAPLSEQQERFLDSAISHLDQREQILPIRLALLAEVVKHCTWDEKSLSKLVGMGDIATAFLQEAFSAKSASAQNRLLQKAARSVLMSLLPSHGRHCDEQARSYADLLSVSGYASRPTQFSSLMRFLTDELRLVSLEPIAGGSGESPGGEHLYRLTSDYLIEPLRDWLSPKRATRQSRKSALRPESDIPKQINCINVNVATKEELKRLPGIGAAIAQRLIEARPFSAIDDLLSVRGIGEKNLREIGPLIGLE